MDIYSTKNMLEGTGLYIEMTLFCIAILIWLFIKTKLDDNRIMYQKEFGNIILSSVIFICIDTGRTITEQVTENNKYLMIVCLFFFITISSAEYCILNYFSLVIRGANINNRAILFCIPNTIAAFFMIVNGISTGRFIFSLLFLLISICLIAGLLGSINRFLLLPLLPFIIVIIHLKFPIISISLGVTVAVVTAYINCLQMLVSMDSLTNVNNRHTLIPVLEKKIKNKEDNEIIYALMLDANKFKFINDSYGHIVGDECLVRISDVLKVSCNTMQKRPYICRYGGDEFIIIGNCNTKEEVAGLEQKIYETLAEYNSVAKEVKFLSITIGVALYDSDKHKTISDFIDAADNCLYYRKNKRD